MANKTYSVNLTDFSGTVVKVPVDVKLSHWTPEQASHMIQGLVEQGLLIILQRATANAQDKKAAILDKVKKLEAGNYTFGEGGASMTPEVAGWIAWLTPKVTIPKGKTLNSRNWTDYGKVVMQRDLLSSGQATKETVVKMVDDNFAKWTEYMEANDEALLLCIKAAKVKTGEIGEKIASGFKIG